eukprot:7420537-Pyramimonas_sp.AAC.1
MARTLMLLSCQSSGKHEGTDARVCECGEHRGSRGGPRNSRTFGHMCGILGSVSIYLCVPGRLQRGRPPP